MLGSTLLGGRLKDLRSVISWLEQRPEIAPLRIGLWGDSPVPVNPPRFVLDELPGWQIGPEIQHQAEPLGGLLGLLGALYDNGVRAVAVRRGLVSYQSILEDRFSYVPFDVIVPGALETGDLAELAAALAPRPVILESLIDGRNRVVPESALHQALAPVYQAYSKVSSPHLLVRSGAGTPGLVEWIVSHL
jgi:hypothetical protein